MVCSVEPIFNYILGVLLCLGGIASYIPQYLSIMKNKQAKGISELSLFILNMSAAFLTANSFILNYDKFHCYDHCNGWLCTGNLLSLFQIAVGWIAVFPLYLLFLRFKVRESENQCLYDLRYMFIYGFTLMFIFLFIIIEESVPNLNKNVFLIFAKILGVGSALLSCIVWIPQIVKLIKTKDPGELSLVMFLFQAPGNAVIIILQVLYKQNWTTWITYVFLLAEQGLIVGLIIYFRYKKNKIENTELQEPLLDSAYDIFDD